jgi:Domain of unknown function (DUF4184)
MPFTFSHPALVLPSRYLPDRFYSMTGLVIGSMTPDFEYFLRMTVGSIYSHTFWGIFYFDLPVGITLCFVFHNVVRDQLIDHLPVQLRERFWDLKTFDWNRNFKTSWKIIFISLIVGAASHIFWDDFTHPLGYFVKRSSFLRHKIHIMRFQLPVYNIFQGLSSLLGGIIVCIFIWRLSKDKINFIPKKDYYWLFVIMTMLLVMTIRFLGGLTFAKYGNIIVSIISSFFIAVILSPLFIQKKEPVN